MEPERWKQIEALCQGALEQKDTERIAFLERACAGDQALRRDVEFLLSHQTQAENFLETPAVQLMVKELAEEKGAKGLPESPALNLTAQQMDQNPSRSLAGQRLGSYQIVSLLGAGGMGEVYKAHDTKLQREVAIKLLPKIFVNDPDRIGRFRREAQLLASLNHPNIATIHGLEQSDGVHYLVMELVAGETLAQRIERAGALPISEALSLCRQIAEALETAHERGIIHRDLKPANVKVTPEGRVKVLDFGLAKAFAGDGSASNSIGPTATEAGTEPGVVLGTPSYMSPEQARGKPADKRTDIWAFGCVLYELLSGRQVFRGDTSADSIAAVVEREPDWKMLPPTIPANIRRLLRRCLEKDANRRLHDIADARIEIEEALVEPPKAVPTAPPPRPWWRAVVWGPVGLLAVIGVVALWSLWRRGPPAQPPVGRFAIPLPQGQFFGDPYAGVGISPDGNQIAYVAQKRDGQRQIYVRQLNEIEGKPVTGTEGASCPVFSPDGKWLAFCAGGGPLLKVALSGGVPQVLYDINKLGKGWYFVNSWMPNGDALIFGTDSGLLRVSAAGGEPDSVTRVVQGAEVCHAYPQILPGGKAVLFTVLKPRHSGWSSSIAVVSLETGQRRTLIEPGTYARYVQTGHLVYVWEGKLLAAPFDLAGLKVTAPPSVVLEGVATGQAAMAQFEVSENGTLIYIPGTTSESERKLVWVDRQGAVKSLAAPARHYETPRLSPDGQRVAVTLERDVWIYDSARDTLSRLTFGGARSPLWTPDGKRVTFSASGGGGTCQLCWKPADGSGSQELLMETERSIDASSWSPDGQVLAFVPGILTDRGGVWLLPLQGERKARPFRQTEFKEGAPVFSPDGHWLAYTSNESGRFEVYVQPFPGPGAKWQISTEGGDQPVWARNGREPFYRQEDRMMAVEVTTRPTFSARSPAQLFTGQYVHRSMHHAPLNPADYDVAPDGRRFLMVQPAAQELSAEQINVVLNWFEELKRRVGPGGKQY